MTTGIKRFVRVLALTLVAPALVTATLTAPAPAAAGHSCHGQRATISGGPGNNKIVGTPHRDVIWAGAGKDRVLSRGGNDLICGGPGRDVIDGQAGSDTIYGGSGKDWCVAWRAREHIRHHGCEIHVGLNGHPAPGKVAAAGAAVSTTAAPSIEVPSRITARQRSTDCGAAGTCDAGVVVCDVASFNYLTAPGVKMPSAYTRDGGLLAVNVGLYLLQNDGTFLLRHAMPWKAYRVGSGWWVLPPSQTLVRLQSAGGVGYMAAWFSYSGDSGGTWSAPQVTVEKTYIFNTFSGWGQNHGDGNLVTGECNLG